MVPYHHNWDSFSKAVVALYEAEPVKTRFCVRWRHDVGLLVIRATDDRKVVKFKARSAVFLNRFDALTRNLIAKMQAVPAPNPVFGGPPKATLPASSAAGSGTATPVGEAAGTAAAGTAGAAAGGGGKKKKGKKKK